MISSGLARYVQSRMIATRIPGLSLAIEHDGVVHQRHFGFRDLTTRLAPTHDTRYGVGSVTKVVTAVAVMQLVSEGAVSLDDRFADLEPVLGKEYGDATLRHVMAHATGLPALGWSETKMSRTWPMDGFPVSTYDDLATFMDGAAGWRTADPGTTWQYGNEAYLALGRLLASIDGVSYGQSVQRRVLGPLAMTRSTFDRSVVASDADTVDPTMTDDHGRFVPGSNLVGSMPSAGGLVSTTHDMLRLARCLAHGGVSEEGERILPQELVETMAAPDVWIDDEVWSSDPIWSDPRRANGPGLQRHVDVLGTDVYAHGGGVMGGTAYLAVAPGRATSVVVLANAHGHPLAQIALVAMATAWGHPPTALPFVRRQELLAACAGRYASYASTIEADVVARPWGLDLVFDQVPQTRTVPLVLEGHDATNDTVRFVALGGGRPARATIVTTAHGRELRFERYALRRKGEVPR